MKEKNNKEFSDSKKLRKKLVSLSENQKPDFSYLENPCFLAQILSL